MKQQPKIEELNSSKHSVETTEKPSQVNENEAPAMEEKVEQKQQTKKGRHKNRKKKQRKDKETDKATPDDRQVEAAKQYQNALQSDNNITTTNENIKTEATEDSLGTTNKATGDSEKETLIISPEAVCYILFIRYFWLIYHLPNSKRGRKNCRGILSWQQGKRFGSYNFFILILMKKL